MDHDRQPTRPAEPTNEQLGISNEPMHHYGSPFANTPVQHNGAYKEKPYIDIEVLPSLYNDPTNPDTKNTPTHKRLRRIMAVGAGTVMAVSSIGAYGAAKITESVNEFSRDRVDLPPATAPQVPGQNGETAKLPSVKLDPQENENLNTIAKEKASQKIGPIREQVTTANDYLVYDHISENGEENSITVRTTTGLEGKTVTVTTHSKESSGRTERESIILNNPDASLSTPDVLINPHTQAKEISTTETYRDSDGNIAGESARLIVNENDMRRSVEAQVTKKEDNNEGYTLKDPEEIKSSIDDILNSLND